jgi:hypothetical protein
MHEYVSPLMQLGVFGFLLIVSSWYNPKQSKKEQPESKFVSAYGVQGQPENIQRGSETSNQHFSEDKLFRINQSSK